MEPLHALPPGPQPLSPESRQRLSALAGEVATLAQKEEILQRTLSKPLGAQTAGEIIEVPHLREILQEHCPSTPQGAISKEMMQLALHDVQAKKTVAVDEYQQFFFDLKRTHEVPEQRIAFPREHAEVSSPLALPELLATIFSSSEVAESSNLAQWAQVNTKWRTEAFPVFLENQIQIVQELVQSLSTRLGELQDEDTKLYEPIIQELRTIGDAIVQRLHDPAVSFQDVNTILEDFQVHVDTQLETISDKNDLYRIQKDMVFMRKPISFVRRERAQDFALQWIRIKNSGDMFTYIKSFFEGDPNDFIQFFHILAENESLKGSRERIYGEVLTFLLKSKRFDVIMHLDDVTQDPVLKKLISDVKQRPGFDPLLRENRIDEYRRQLEASSGVLRTRPEEISIPSRICYAYLLQKDLNGALGAAGDIPDPQERSIAYAAIAQKFLEKGNVADALRVGSTVPIGYPQFHFLKGYFTRLSILNGLESSLQMLDKMKTNLPPDQFQAIQTSIFMNFIPKKGVHEIQKAFDMSRTMDELSRILLCLRLVRLASQYEPIQKTLEIWNSVPAPEEMELVLQLANQEMQWKVEGERDNAIYDFVDALIRDENYSKAIEVANTMTSPRVAEQLLQKISHKMEQQGMR